jgi:hypothetical protein
VRCFTQAQCRLPSKLTENGHVAVAIVAHQEQLAFADNKVSVSPQTAIGIENHIRPSGKVST